jgi:hypothetical protein|tara:strand:- start:14 stop:325 length:312 start_codon:yes stop_codon:yes gene_type:complete
LGATKGATGGGGALCADLTLCTLAKGFTVPASRAGSRGDATVFGDTTPTGELGAELTGDFRSTFGFGIDDNVVTFKGLVSLACRRPALGDGTGDCAGELSIPT